MVVVRYQNLMIFFYNEIEINPKMPKWLKVASLMFVGIETSNSNMGEKISKENCNLYSLP